MKMKHVSQHLWGAAFATLSVVLLPACSDDDFKVNAEVEVPSDAHLDTGLAAYSHVIPLEIKSNAKWKVQFDESGDEIAYVYPVSGQGNATVKLCVLDNVEDSPRTGTMTIVFPDDPTQNQVFNLRQNSTAATDDNFNPEVLGDMVYGIGYGFDITKGVGPTGLTRCLLKVEKLKEDKMVMKVPGFATDVTFSTYTGTTVKEISSDFEATAKFEASGYGVEAEANATFNMNDYSKEENEFAMTYMDVLLEEVKLQPGFDELSEYKEDEDGVRQYTWLTQAFGKALNAPDDDKKYPSSDVGYARLVKTYGTHVVTDAILGGRLLYSAKINTSQIKEEYDLDAFARLAYDGIFSAEATAKETYKNSFESNKKYITSYAKAWGGDVKHVLDMAGKVGDDLTPIYDEWKNSLSEDDNKNAVFLGIHDKTYMIPIYDLVENEERAEGLRRYITETYGKSKTSSVDMGVQGYVEDITDVFKGEEGESLIKDVVIQKNGATKTIARICNEVVRDLGDNTRVNVIYPVVNGVTKWNMGYCPVNVTGKPQRISHVNGKVIVSALVQKEPEDGEKGVYVRGTSITQTDVNEGLEVVDAATNDYKAMLIRDKAYDYYPVVKIEDKIWMRENFAALRSDKNDVDYRGYMCGKMGDNCFYYPYGAVKEARSIFIPDGWNLPKAADIDTMVSLLKKKNVNPGKGFSEGGMLGLDMVPMGYLKDAPGGDFVQEDSGRAYLLLDDPTNMNLTGSSAWKYGTAAVVNPESGVVVSSRLLGPLEGLRIPVRFYQKIE